MPMADQVLTDEIAVVVKHTFINVSLPSTAQNSLRRSSVPAGMWLCPFALERAEMCAMSDASTDSATDWSSESQEEREQDVDIATKETVENASICDESTMPSTLRTPLRSIANPWQPLQAWQSQRFDKQVADIKAKVEVAMVCSGCDADVHIRKESNGYTISVSLSVEDAERFGNDILAEAQEAILTASEQSTCVYVIGKDYYPFQAVSNGFVTTLAEMQDTEAACWDIYSWGTCPHGCACVRQHPRSVAYMMVQLIA
mmetsp:Transcript_35432/g.56495  ORF Transcript_35432/g.56495 Transcript_35432/m.56495 type:complete len:258 (+) Transcript_35432:62-835(+)